MTNSKTRGVRRLLLDRLGVDDNQLAYEIVQFVMTPDPEPIKTRHSHPAVLLAKRITGKQIPPAMIDEIVRALGDNPDEQRARECHLQMVKRGYEGAWYWLDDYAGTSKKQKAQAPAFQPSTTYEWVE